MAYVKQEWKNLPNQTTPVNATRMIHIEDGIASIDIFKNLFNVGNSILSGANVTFSNTDNQIKINGTSTTESNIFLDSPSANKDKEGIILKAGTYTATIRKISGSLANNLVGFYLRKSDGTSIYNGTSLFTQTIGADVSDGTAYSKTFTLTEETRLHWTGFFSNFSTTFNNLVLQFQIEESSSATEYAPFAGYIVESGSNSNGKWIKYSDGTMICYQSFTCNVNYSTKYGSGYYAEITDEIKSFPVSFIETPKVSVGLTTNYGIGCALRDTNTEKCATNIFVYTFVSRTDTVTLNIIAIGKWK